MKIKSLILLAVLFLSSGKVLCEEKPEKTHLFEGYSISDSLEYSAESIRYLYNERKVILTGNAFINYLGHTLKSHEIIYYQDYDYMEAVGAVDSSGTLTNTPVFKDAGGEEMRGLKIKYNLNTQEGYIQKGITEYESGFMAAEKIKRASDDTLFVADGTYTTCDKEENPHYYFAGKQMKFILNDKLIIKPIVGYVHDIPVFWFPFYVFPIKKGRQSGFLTPRYGSSRREGRYFSNIGYYFAPSDYMDYRFAGTLRERNGWLLNNWLNYNKKYRMSGSVFGSYENRTESGSDSKQYKLRVSHRHTVSPTLTIDGSGRFESSTYSQYNSRNVYERLNRDMRSTLSIRKRWKESGNSLITTASYTRNLDRKTTDTSLPNISFRKPRKLLFGSDTKKSKRKYVKNSAVDENKRWYNSIYYSFNTQLNNRNTKREDSSDFTRDMKLSTSLSNSQKLMGWLVSEPSLNLNENFTVTNTGENTERYKRMDNMSMGLRLGTTVYGMFKPSIGSLTALRHVITPSISYSYGKKRSFTGENADVLYRFDKNDEDKGRASRMSINLRNIFQAKTVNGDKERKFDLFTLNFSSSVDFEKDNRRIAPLRTTFDFKPLKVITTRLTASHDFYDDDDTFHLFSPYMDNLSITTNVGLSQSRLGFMGTSSRDNANTNLGRDDFDMARNSMEGGLDERTGSKSVPFNLRFSHTYGIRRSKLPGKDKYTVTNTIKPTLTFSPSRNFSVNYYCYYNIEKKNLVDQRVVINRNLHCWEANISWVPSGIREGFYFKVNIKDLPDVKIERRRGTSRISY